MEPMLKSSKDRKYHSIPEVVMEHTEINLKYVSSNQSIQVRDAEGRFLGNMKYMEEKDYAAETISG